MVNSKFRMIAYCMYYFPIFLYSFAHMPIGNPWKFLLEFFPCPFWHQSNSSALNKDWPKKGIIWQRHQSCQFFCSALPNMYPKKWPQSMLFLSLFSCTIGTLFGISISSTHSYQGSPPRNPIVRMCHRQRTQDMMGHCGPMTKTSSNTQHKVLTVHYV